MDIAAVGDIWESGIKEKIWIIKVPGGMKTSSLLFLQRQNIDIYVLSTSVLQAARMVY